MKFAALFFILMSAGLSQAGEKAVVQQMKGRRAIIQFEKDIPFSVGQKIFLSSEEGTEIGLVKEQRNPLERKNLVSLGATISQIDTEVKSSGTTTKSTQAAYTLTGRYGWNLERYEFGPLVAISYSKTKNKQTNISSEVSRYAAGGFFDLNLVPNKPGEDFIFGAYGEASVGNAKISSNSRSLTNFTGGGFAKWFILSPMLAARANLFYSYEMQSNDATQTAMGVEFGFTHYF